MIALAEVDAVIERYRAAAGTTGVNLAELERDPRRQLLDAAALTGCTATTWAEARRSLANLWQWYARFTRFIDEATSKRGTRARLDARIEQELAAFLAGPSIELARVDVSVSARQLLDDREETTYCTADALLDAMSSHFNWVRGVIVTATAAWDQLVPRMGRISGDLDAATTCANELGAEIESTVAHLRALANEIAEKIAGDPLGIDGSKIDELDDDVAALHATLTAATSLRDNAVERLERARSTVAELARVEELVDGAYRDAQLKIAAPDVEPPNPRGADLSAQLDAVVRLCDEHRWRDAQQELDAWIVDANEAIHGAYAGLEATRAPMEERNELRGRLDAYAAMAYSLDVVEDRQISRLYERARDELYTAPTDLAHAHKLVTTYQHALATRRAEQGEHR